MKTIICDIDGTLTNLWPIEKKILSCLLPKETFDCIEKLKRSGVSETYLIYRKIANIQITKKVYRKKYNKMFEQLWEKELLPPIEKFPLADWVLSNQQYQYVYTTGGQQAETLYALEQLGILQLFDIQNSIDKTRYPFSKKTGLPFKKILKKYQDCILVTDSRSDCEGAKKVGMFYVLVKPGVTVSQLEKKLGKYVYLGAQR